MSFRLNNSGRWNFCAVAEGSARSCVCWIVDPFRYSRKRQTPQIICRRDEKEFEPPCFALHSTVTVGHVVRHGDGAVVLVHDAGSILQLQAESGAAYARFRLSLWYAASHCPA